MKPAYLSEPTTAEECLARVRAVRARLFAPPARTVEPIKPSERPPKPNIEPDRVLARNWDRWSRVAELYADGLTPKAIAQEVGYERSETVIRALRAMGVYDPSRTLSRPNRENQRAKWPLVAELHGQGLGPSEIARRVGYRCHTSVIHALKAMGLYAYMIDPELVARRAEARKNPETSQNARMRAARAARLDAGLSLKRDAKLTAEAVRTIRREMDRFPPKRSAARTRCIAGLSLRYGVSRAMILRVAQRLAWKRLP